MQKRFKQRALRYRELARDVFDDRARDQILRLAAEYDEASATPSSEDQAQRKPTD